MPKERSSDSDQTRTISICRAQSANYRLELSSNHSSLRRLSLDPSHNPVPLRLVNALLVVIDVQAIANPVDLRATPHLRPRHRNLHQFEGEEPHQYLPPEVLANRREPTIIRID